MPIPQTIRVNPLDLQKNIVIGVSLPFNAPGVFNKTYSTKEQTKSNLINLLLTDKGERIMNPEFGTDLRKSLFDNITNSSIEILSCFFKRGKRPECIKTWLDSWIAPYLEW